MRVELGGGHWVEIREDLDRVPYGDRKQIMREMARAADDFERNAGFGEGTLRVLITAWSYELPIPKEKPEALDEIPGHDFDRMMKAVGGLEQQLFLKFEPTPDLASPTPPSGD